MKIKKRITALLLSVMLCFLTVLPINSLAASANSYAFGVEILTPSTIYVDDIINITLKLNNITTPLAGVEYIFKFDGNFLTPAITENANDEMSIFMSKTPPNGWEQLCKYDAESSSYHLRFVTNDGGTDDNNLVKTESDLIISIPFTVKSAGDFNLAVQNTEILGIDKNLASLKGLGSSITAKAINDLNRFSITLSLPEKVYQGSQTNLTVTITNKKDNSGLIGAQFKLFYDNTAVVPIITKNNADQMNAFFTQTPNSSWEQMCSFDNNTSCYSIRLAANHVGSVENEILKIGTSIKLTIPFTVTGETNASALFSVSSDSCLATNNIPKSISGQGSSISFSILKNEKIRLESNSALSISTVDDKPLVGGIKGNTSVSDLLTQFANTGLVIKDYKGNIITSGICKTGYVVCLYNGSNLFDSVTLIIKGDLNRDGKVNSIDYLFIKRAFIGSLTLDNIQLQAAYVTGKPVITAANYLIIKRHVLGTYNLYA